MYGFIGFGYWLVGEGEEVEVEGYIFGGGVVVLMMGWVRVKVGKLLDF